MSLQVRLHGLQLRSPVRPVVGATVREVEHAVVAACRDVVADYISNAKDAVGNLPTGSEPLLTLTDCLTQQLAGLDD